MSPGLVPCLGWPVTDPAAPCPTAGDHGALASRPGGCALGTGGEGCL